MVDERIETVDGRKEEAHGKLKKNDTERDRKIQTAVISQVWSWFITQTHCRDTLLKDT